MKILIQTLFVYIPFGVCVLLQAFSWFALNHSGNDGKAQLIKVVFPILLVAATILHFVKRKKNEV